MRCFVTATGTDIGKTWLSAALVRRRRRLGREVLALKPVLSGFDPADPGPSDAGILLEAMGRPVTPDALDAIAPWRYRAPLSPDMAAALEGRPVDFDAVVAFCRRRAAEWPGDLLVEGVGGCMVPLTDDRTVLDWMAGLGLPALLVTGSYLGTLSHTLTAAHVLAARGIPVAAVVVNETPAGTVPLDATVESLRRHLPGAPRIVALPRGTPDLDARLDAIAAPRP